MSEFLNSLRRAVDADRLQPLDLALADWCLRHGGGEAVALAAALASRAVAEGHACLRLPAAGLELGPGDLHIDADTLHTALADSPLVGGPGATTPLVLDADRLYLQRYWHYEAALATRLRTLIAAAPMPVDPAPLGAHGGLFDYDWVASGETNWQAVAAAAALRHRFTVISGGPGTGKTYTVLRLIHLLVTTATSDGRPSPEILLAAPTGKAAARMMESIRAGLATLPATSALHDQLPGKASTLHRLLGLHGGTVLPRYHRDNPIPADVVMVDEASMIDLPMMAKLMDALPEHARLILLGDRYQLASVEAGSVLAEVCGAAGVNHFSAAQCAAFAPLLGDARPAAGPPPLADHVVTLRTSHRFHAGSPIGRLAAAVNAGDAEAALRTRAESDPTVQLLVSPRQDLDALAQTLAATYLPLLDATDPAVALASLDAVRLLTATRVGDRGAIAMNRRIQDQLGRLRNLDTRQTWYHGRPIIVRHNDYRLGLFNGDAGVCLRDADGHLRVWFRTEDGLRSHLPSALPDHESAFAMTVHKSQGSEFRRVWLLLPERDLPLLTRELIYTGITRARDAVTVLGPESVLRAALSRTVQRHSGLAQRLAAE
ncbi:MAG: exodeoxyribonuclease V subunit alpha [Pseudomonadales bacterium]|nr:exodeoxyribonuclease V subunit alpha [Pseudomonadales bacterium]MCP5185959.1 exodeoxyribonuclease V subunit alpha [Pseudomonadales bacterium]